MRGHKEFQEGQKVLLFKSRMKLFPMKLKTRWYAPFIVKQVFPHGAIDLIKEDGINFEVNGQQVKNYEEGSSLNNKRKERVIGGSHQNVEREGV